MPSKHFLIFSHGFGIRKDAGGLFTEIIENLQDKNVECVTFDYNTIDAEKNEITVPAFSEQVSILERVVDKIQLEYPNTIIDIIGHSQGSIVVALAKLKNIRKTILLAPFFQTDPEETKKRYESFSGSEIQFDGISRRTRSDGSTTIIHPQYWKERFRTNLDQCYNDLATGNDVTVIYSPEDKIYTDYDTSKLVNINLITTHCDHDFKPPHRENLIRHINTILF